MSIAELQLLRTITVCAFLSTLFFIRCVPTNHNVKKTFDKKNIDSSKYYYKKAYEAESFNEIIELFNKSIKHNPSYADAYCGRGNIKGTFYGNYEEAIKDYNKAIKLKPNTSEFYMRRGNAKNHLGKHKKAIKDFTEAIALDSSNMEARFGCAVAYALLKDKQGVLTSLKEAISLDASVKEKVKNNASFDWLQNDPDFQALVR